jgi:hypothetical protein
VAVAVWQSRDADRFLNGRNRSRIECFIVVFDAVGSKCGSGKVAVAVVAVVAVAVAVAG